MKSLLPEINLHLNFYVSFSRFFFNNSQVSINIMRESVFGPYAFSADLDLDLDLFLAPLAGDSDDREMFELLDLFMRN